LILFEVHSALGTAERELAAQDRELDRRHAVEEEETKVHEEIEREIGQLWSIIGVDPKAEIPGDAKYMGKVSKLCVTLSALTTRVQLRIQDEEGRAHRALAYVEVCVWRECLAVSLYRGTPLWLLRSRYCWSNPLPVVHRLSPTSSRKREIRAPG